LPRDNAKPGRVFSIEKLVTAGKLCHKNPRDTIIFAPLYPGSHMRSAIKAGGLLEDGEYHYLPQVPDKEIPAGMWKDLNGTGDTKSPC
jgi:hypothetical protein